MTTPKRARPALDPVEHQGLPETAIHWDTDDCRKPINVIDDCDGKISLCSGQLL